METFKVDAALRPTLRKIQDFLSIKAEGERLDAEIFRGIRADYTLVESTLDALVEVKILIAEATLMCPNAGCGIELTNQDEQFHCDDCDEHVDRDEAMEGRLLIVSSKIARTLDAEWIEDQGIESFVLSSTGEVIKGERDEHHIYLVKELAVLGSQIELLHGSAVLKLHDYRFHPEYGRQPRRHVYSYTELKGSFTMNQNVNVNGNHNSFGNISQQGPSFSAGTSNEVFLALIAGIQKVASENNVRDERLIKVLETAVANGSSSRGITATLNHLVSLAADYSAVIGPFVPQITALLAAIQKV